MTDELRRGPLVGDRYQLEHRLASGGMSDVFVAYDEVLDRRVAVKILFRQYAADERFVARFRREAKAVANLNHPNIVAVYDWGRHEDTYFIAMELVDGQSLADILASEGRLDGPEAITITRAVVGALGHAHQNGIVHRDVKPGNVLLTRTGDVKVTDFGIAFAVEGDANLTQTGQVMGTASYFSPEQAQGDSVGPRSDLYSVGVMLFEMVIGTLPFTGTSPVAIAYKHVHDEAPTPSSVDPSMPPSLDAIVSCLMAKVPDDRYPTAAELEADLARLASGRPVAARSQGTVAAERREPGNRTTLASATVAMAPAATGSVDATQAMPAPDQGEPPTSGTDQGYYEPTSRSGLFSLILIALVLAAIGSIVFVTRTVIRDAATAAGTTGPITVPQLIGETEAAASNRLTDLGLVVRVTFEERADFEPGVVLDQQPTAGTEVQTASEVTIVVVASAEAVEVPNVVSRPVNEAVDELAAAGFEVRLRREESDTIDVDHIIGQSIEGGQLANDGATVTLTVSSGGRTGAVTNPASGGSPTQPTTEQSTTQQSNTQQPTTTTQRGTTTQRTTSTQQATTTTTASSTTSNTVSTTTTTTESASTTTSEAGASSTAGE